MSYRAEATHFNKGDTNFCLLFKLSTVGKHFPLGLFFKSREVSRE